MDNQTTKTPAGANFLGAAGVALILAFVICTIVAILSWVSGGEDPMRTGADNFMWLTFVIFAVAYWVLSSASKAG